MPFLDRLIAFCLVLLFATMTVVATGYQYEARLMPLVIGLPAILLAAYLCVRPSTGQRAEGDASPDAGASRAALIAIGWLTAFAALVALGGEIVGGSMAVALTQRAWLRETRRTALIGGALSAALLMTVFERQLGIALFRGILAEWLP